MKTNDHYAIFDCSWQQVVAISDDIDDLLEHLQDQLDSEDFTFDYPTYCSADYNHRYYISQCDDYIRLIYNYIERVDACVDHEGVIRLCPMLLESLRMIIAGHIADWGDL